METMGKCDILELQDKNIMRLEVIGSTLNDKWKKTTTQTKRRNEALML